MAYSKQGHIISAAKLRELGHANSALIRHDEGTLHCGNEKAMFMGTYVIKDALFRFRLSKLHGGRILR